MKATGFFITSFVLIVGSKYADSQVEKIPKSEAKGSFITTVGTHKLYGGKITVKIEEANGKLDSFIKRNKMEGETRELPTWGPLNPRIKKEAPWFVYTESADEAWWFDGDKHLYLLPFSGRRHEYEAGGLYQLDAKHLTIAPKAVLDRLPETFKELPKDKHESPTSESKKP
jgi:hypothetical protein